MIPPSEKPRPLRFSCPHCRVVLEIPADLAGIRGPCPDCQAEIEAPGRPQPIEIKPRRPRPPRSTAPVPAIPLSAGQEMIAPGAGIPALGEPPPGHEGGLPSPRPESPGAGMPAATPPGTGMAGGAAAPPGGDRGQQCSSRAISPITGMSSTYEDRQATITLIKILVAALLTFGAALGIAAMVNKNFREAPAESPSGEHGIP